MATRTPYVATELAGDVLTAANFNRLPGGLIGHCEQTATQTGITTAVDLVGNGDSSKMSLTVTPNNATRMIRIQFAIFVQMTIASTHDAFRISVLKDGTQIGAADAAFSDTTSGQTINGVIVDAAPTAASHVYKLQGVHSFGTGTFTVAGSSTQPSVMYLFDDGPSF